MSYNPEIHHRRSIRLKGYDYSREGIYFITICVQDRDCLFGEIVAGAISHSTLQSPIMILNNAGKMVERWYRELENKYPDKRCHEMVIMPNHFHCIIENVGAGSQLNNGSQLDDVSQLGAHVGAPLRGRPMINDNVHPNDIDNMHPNDIDNVHPNDIDNVHPNDIDNVHPNDIDNVHPNDEKYGLHNKKYNVAIGNLVDWFKTMTTNEYIRSVKQYGWKRFDGKLWQRNYYEHVIRSLEEYERIADYILNNPAKWQQDKFFN